MSTRDQDPTVAAAYEAGKREGEPVAVAAALVREMARRMRTTPAPAEFPRETPHQFSRVVNQTRTEGKGGESAA